MKEYTAIQYNALDEDSYNSLAAYAITTPATVCLHPELDTIVISDSVSDEIGKFIDREGLDFNISPVEFSSENLKEVVDNPITDADTLRNIIYTLLREKEDMAEAHRDAISDIIRQKDVAENDRDRYKDWFYESNNKENRIKEQVKAIAVLINSIYPKE